MDTQDCLSTPRKVAFERGKTLSGTPTSKGKTKMLQWLNTGRISRADAILAKCFECMGCYIDGRIDCEMIDCPLYPYMPYRGRRPRS